MLVYQTLDLFDEKQKLKPPVKQIGGQPPPVESTYLGLIMETFACQY